MSGEVIHMFGDENTGPFGTTTVSGPEVAVPEVEVGPGGPVQSGPSPNIAGNAEPPMLPAQALMGALDVALTHARTAHHRAVDLLPPGYAQFEKLSDTFTQLQANIASVARDIGRAQTEDAMFAVNRDAREVVAQVQQYIEAVESEIQQTGGTQIAPSRRRNRIPFILAMAAGAGVVGYALWKLNKRRKKK